MAFTMITVTRTYKTPAGYPAQGIVRFTPSDQMVNGTTTISSPEWDELDKNGALSLVLAANNNPGTTPVGTTYQVQEIITGQADRTYNVIIPYNAPSATVDLSTLAPASTTPPAITYVSSVNGVSGAVTIPDATTTIKGVARILGGSADAPSVPWSALTGVDADVTGLAALGDGFPSRTAGTWSARTATQLRDDVGAQPLSTLLTRLAATPVVITYAASITPDASQACVFYCTATGNLTIADIINGVAGQPVYIQVTASGATRLLVVTGVSSYIIPSGERWSGTFRYDSVLSGFVRTG